MIYGAYGFTGRLIVEEALRRGHRPVLAGRNKTRLEAMSGALGLSAVPFSLEAGDGLRAALRPVRLILNASGPAYETGMPLIDACFETGTSYADISGELGYLNAVLKLDSRAQQAKIALLTGAGFGVTLGDCLARQAADGLPDAVSLRLSIAANNAQTTPSVRKTILSVLAGGGFAVEKGGMRSRALAHRAYKVCHRGQIYSFAAAPLGELAAAFHSTRIPNIVTGRPMPAGAAKILRILSPAIGLALSVGPLSRALGRNIKAPEPPKPHDGQECESWLLAEAENARGDRCSAMIETGEGYAVTSRAALSNVEALLERDIAGAFTPAAAFGAAHLQRIPGVRVTSL
jgi:short subunit dehydrogenase-like uncharacterized protein